MGQGQDENDEGGYTPYQPDATPDGEPAGSAPADPGAPPPYVPYGTGPDVPNVPYGDSINTIGTSSFVVNASGGRWVGWVLGIVIALVACGGSAIGILAGALSDNDPSSSSDSNPSFSVDIPSFSVDIPSFSVDVPSIPPQVFANDLKRSQCLIGAGFEPGSNQGISNLEVTDCAGAHNAQVLEVRVLSQREAADYDFTDSDQGNESCFPLFSPAQKALFQGDEYTLLSFTETASPTQGDKVACLVVRTDGKLYRGFLPKKR